MNPEYKKIKCKECRHYNELVLYHVITLKKLSKYKITRFIYKPVRGFTTLEGAERWAKRVGRTVIIKFVGKDIHKLPNYHNSYGRAWWNDKDVYEYEVLKI